LLVSLPHLWYYTVMAKRRTRKDKRQARHMALTTISLPATPSSTQTTKYHKLLDKTTLPAIETVLIKKDLWKSLLISGLILLVEFGIYGYWNH
jgi:hypothetical protein